MKKVVFILTFLVCQSTVLAQLGVGTNTPDASAQLDVTATDKGFLAPRIALTSTTDVTTIASPATGLMVYNTATAGTAPSDVTPGYYYFDGVKWVRFINSQPTATISFNTVDPNTGTPTFSPNTPNTQNVIYISSSNNSMWTYNGTSYVSFTPTTLTPFFLASTSNDAGSNKTLPINRTGSITSDNGFLRASNSSTQNILTIDPTEATGPRIKIGTTSLINSFLELGSYNSQNNVDTKNRDLQFFGNGAGNTVGLMLKASTGYFGIGSNNPLTNMHVNSQLLATATNNVDAPILRLSRPQTPGLKWDNIAQFNLGSYGTSSNAQTRLDLVLNNSDATTFMTGMTWLANGFVGVGTTAPTANLDIVSSMHIRSLPGAAGSNYGIEFNTNSSAPRIDWVFNGAYIGQFASDANDFHLRNSKLATGGFRFYTNPAGSQVERMTVLNNGNVGVNTSTPTTTFHVTGVITQDMTTQDNFSNGINIRKRGNTSSSTGAATSGAEIGYHSFFGWNGTSYARGAYVLVNAAENYTSTANGTNYSIYTTAVGSTSTVERLRIAHNGNIGIGTSNPNGALTLYGNSSMSLPTNIQGQTGATKELVFGKGGLFNGFAAITGVENGQYGGGLSFMVKSSGSDNFPTSGVQAMVLDWNARMGIGTGSPTQRLDVNGQVRIRTISTGSNTDSLLVVNGGVIRSVAKSAPVNTQSTNYTLTTSDNGAILIMNSSSAVTVTVPATLPAGFVVQIIQKGAGQVTVAGSGSTINSANGLKTRTVNSAIGVVMESATLGYVTGDSNF